LISDLYETLGSFTRLEGIQTEYGPGQVETNLIYTDALAAADDSARLKYAAKEVARRRGKLASFMPKPFSEHSGSSAHLHISLWRDGAPAFEPEAGAESRTALLAIAGLLDHLPSITLFGAHSVNAYRRFAPDTFAPDTVNWSRDNRSAAVRSLVESTPGASRIELRTGASDSNPYWLIAAALAAIVAGLEAGRPAPERASGNLYGKGTPLPDSLGTALALASQDDTILEILGADTVLDFVAIAASEWQQYVGHVSDWERQRYLAGS
jgi:glutamine synthetase